MTNIVEMPLFPKYDYNYSINLEDNSYNFRFTYNEIMQLYTITVSDEDGNKIVAGVGLVPNYPILLDYAIPELTGALVLTTNADTNKEYYKLYPEDIDKYYTLGYYYDVATE